MKRPLLISLKVINKDGQIARKLSTRKMKLINSFLMADKYKDCLYKVTDIEVVMTMRLITKTKMT